MLDLAWQKNPKQFSQLLCQEFSYLQSELDVKTLINKNQMKSLLQKRESFYRRLMSQPDMINFFDYEQCRSVINSFFKNFDLKIIRPPKINASALPTKQLPSLYDEFEKNQGEDDDKSSSQEKGKITPNVQNSKNEFGVILKKISDFFTPKLAEKTNEKKVEAVQENTIGKKIEEKEMVAIKKPDNNDFVDDDSDHEDSLTL